jgi:2-polyprenyl-3-methyl-5-hydroxy-6-metoxy-1,4-benzoquinol methylase
MDSNSIKTYSHYEQTYWWFVGRRKIIKNILNQYLPRNNYNILDWGCGTGANFNILKQFGTVLGVDASKTAINECKSKGFNNVLLNDSINTFQTNIPIDLFTSFDVLEHLKDDNKFLQNIHKIIKKDSYVLVTVPTYQFLWSNLDEIVGHERRYNRSELISKFENNGFRVLKASYFNTILSPIFIVVRLLQKVSNKKAVLEDLIFEVPPIINNILKQILIIESKLLQKYNFSFGTSIILLATPK